VKVPVEKWELWLLQLQDDSDQAAVLRHGVAAMRAFPDRDCRELVGRQVGLDGRVYQTLLADVPQVLLELAGLPQASLDPREAVYSFWREPVDPTRPDGMDRALAGVAVIEAGAGAPAGNGATVALDAEEIRRMLYEFRPSRRGSRLREIYTAWLGELHEALCASRAATAVQEELAGTPASEVK
jgi:hypothetical protein